METSIKKGGFLDGQRGKGARIGGWENSEGRREERVLGTQGDT